MSRLSIGEDMFFSRLRADGVLVEVNPCSMEVGNGVIVVACGDGDQITDYYTHMLSLCRPGQEVLERDRLHLEALNGGPVLLSKGWYRPVDGDVLEFHIAEAVELKRIHTVVLIGHAPCGAVAEQRIAPRDYINRLFDAKIRVEALNGVEQVIVLVHVDWDGVKKRTYHLDKSKWLVWCRDHQGE